MKRIRSLFSMALLGAWCLVAASQPYPHKPIRLIVPFAPGQGADSAARLVAQKLSDNLKQPIVIDNRPGAGGNIGAEAAAKAAPDGYTLLVGSNGTHAANAALYSTLPYRPQEDFVPISFIGSVPMVLLANTSSPVSGAKDLIAMAKAKPGEITMAVPSSTSRVVLELFTRITKTAFNPIGYKASGAAMTDLMGGHVQFSIDTVIAGAPQVTSGKLKALAVSSSKRSNALPAVETLVDQGVPGFDLAAWNVWFAPRGTPPEIVAKLNGELRKVLADGEVKARLQGLGYEPDGTQSPAQVGEFVGSEAEKWAGLIRAAGIKAE